MSSGYYAPLESGSPAQTRQGAGDILVSKRSILSNPGTKIDNTLYYSALNTTVQVSEITWTSGRFSQSLQSLNFGSTSTITIPNGSFLQNVMLHLELPPLPANISIGRGWGFQCINSINFLLGSSNVPQISLSGQSLFQIIMAQCETTSKRNEVLALAGQELLTSTFPDIQPPITVNSAADLVIPLPFSGMAGKDHQLPFDTSLLQNPITIQINFNPGSTWIRGAAASGITAFAGASAQCRLGDMLNRDQGLKRIMQQDSDLILGYPFMHYQAFQQGFTGVPLNPLVAGFNSTFVTINMLGFINADLCGIIFGCVKNSDLSNNVNNPVNPLFYEELSNVQVLFNGLVMHATPKQQHKLTNMMSRDDASYVANSYINNPTSNGIGPYMSAGTNTYPIYITFSQKQTLAFNMEYENVWRVPNNTITLQFNTPVGTDATQYTMYATYVYNGICNIRGGESDIFFS